LASWLNSGYGKESFLEKHLEKGGQNILIKTLKVVKEAYNDINSFDISGMCFSLLPSVTIETSNRRTSNEV